MINLTLIRYVLTAALRDRLLMTFILMLVVGISTSLFVSGSAVIEQDQFTLVFAGGAMRLIMVTALILFVVFHMRRSFETKDVEFLLSRPISRLEFIFAHSFAFSLLAFALGAIAGGVIISIGPHEITAGTFLWAFSVVIESIIVANIALFFSMVISSAVGAAMACFGFYVLGRMMGQLLGIIDSHITQVQSWLEVLLQIISSVMPRLDLMGQTSWLLYGPGNDVGLGYLFLQGLVFLILVILASVIDLLKREF